MNYNDGAVHALEYNKKVVRGDTMISRSENKTAHFRVSLLCIITMALCAVIFLLTSFNPASAQPGYYPSWLFPADLFSFDSSILLGDKKVKPEEEKGEKILLPSYEVYIKDPSKLGFSPDSKMFRAAYLFIKTQYVVPVEDAVLVKSCEKEMNRLLKEAKVQNGVPFKISSFDGIDKEIERFSPSLNKDLLYYAAIEGMLLGLSDPYTVLMTPKEYRTLMEQMEAVAFGGIGIYIELDKENGNALTVFEPIEGTPAYKVGLQPQDAIMFINGESTKGMPLEIAVGKLRGPVGSNVTVSIKRSGVSGLKNVTITRDNIKIHSVSCKVIGGKYGYIRIRTFGEETGNEVGKALTLLSQKNVKGLILDLRNNGGGYIDAAIKVCSYFVPTGNLVVYVVDRTGQRKDYKADSYSKSSLPLVVLVNKFSASASEITAGALQDYKLGVLMGGKTFGKGSVQNIMPMQQIFSKRGGPDGAFKITIAHYFTPKGRNIDKKGISPDIESKMEPKLVGRKGDSQMIQAVKYLNGRL